MPSKGVEKLEGPEVARLCDELEDRVIKVVEAWVEEGNDPYQRGVIATSSLAMVLTGMLRRVTGMSPEECNKFFQELQERIHKLQIHHFERRKREALIPTKPSLGRGM